MFVPLTCSDALADGTCEGTATFIESIAGVSTTCAEDAAGDCLCDVGGQWNWITYSFFTEDGAGALTERLLDGSADGTYDSVTDPVSFETDGTTLRLYYPNLTTSFTFTRAAEAATSCEEYCFGFTAVCGENMNATSYESTSACLTSCGGFTPGSDGDATGDSLACRQTELRRAADPSSTESPNLHCPNAQANPADVCL